MKNNKKNHSILLLILIMILMVTSCGQQELTKDNLDSYMNKAAERVAFDAAEPMVSSVSGEWAVFGLNCAGKADQDYNDRYYENLKATLKSSKGILSEDTYTDYARAAICVRAIGKDPTNVEGYNLLKPLDEGDKVIAQGINGPIFSLIASSYCGTPLESEDAYIKEIVAWMGTTEQKDSVDLTAMALQSLSYYQGRADVDKAIEEGITYLSKKQGKDGGYESSETTSQVIIALTCLHMDPLGDKKFTKDDKNLGDGLMKFWKGNGFLHKVDDEEVNPMATEQGLLALCAIKMFDEGRTLFERIVV